MTLDEFIAEWNNDSATLTVHTSGSTGKPKDIIVEKARMLSSARMTCDTLHLKKDDTALLCMPLDYIAGKMMVVRSLERGLKLICVDPCSHPLRYFADKNAAVSNGAMIAEGEDSHIDFAAFVPLQVAKTLEDMEETEVFRNIKNVIIGGGFIDDELEGKLKTMPNNIFSTYGMTETLSHIALRRINGEDSGLWYTPMNNVSVSLSADSCLIINAPHLSDTQIITNDIAEINAKGQFRIIGRKDNTINTGGIKVQIEEVERRLLLEGMSDFMITSVKDSIFGECITLLVQSHTTEGHVQNADADTSVKNAISTLPKYWQPKHIIYVDSLPKTGNGKPDRKKAKEMANSLYAREI